MRQQLDARARGTGDALPAPFGRMFPDLAPGPPPDRPDHDSGDRDRRHDPDGRPGSPEPPVLARPDDGFGRLVAHDLGIVADPVPGILPSPTTRPPRLALDGLYGPGPMDAPHLYDPTDRARLRAGAHDAAPDAARHRFAALHDAVVDEVRAEGLVFWPVVFSEARRRVVHQYQRVVLDGLLPAWVGRTLVDVIRRHGRRFYRPVDGVFVPLELLALAPWLVPGGSPAQPCPAAWTLPPGRAVAAALDVAPLAPTDVAPGAPLDAYVAAESRIVGDGRRLGPVGGRILAEVVLGVLELDVDSCLGVFAPAAPPEAARRYWRTVSAVATA
jgi:hypothetical protein